MDNLKMCCVAPHPPILVPEIGGPEARKVSSSAESLETLASEIEALNPDALVIMSPHSPLSADAFTVRVAPSLGGSFSQFGEPGIRVDTTADVALARAVATECAKLDVPCEPVGGKEHPFRGSGDLDHGILVPLYFLARKAYPLVCLSMSFLDYQAHYLVGLAIRRAVESSGRKCVFIASGDMSHRLTPSASAGYSPRGAEFDRTIVDILESGDLFRLFELDARLIDEAGECGLRSLFALAGTVDGYARSSDVLSYEGPFGVGYLVARVVPGERDESLTMLSEGDRP